MKAAELRIGNWIENSFQNYAKVYGVQSTLEAVLIDNEWQTHEIVNCKPIPITSEWLERLGFEKDKGSDTSFSHSESNDLYVCGFGYDYYLSMRYCSFETNVGNVHQLQNLYYALEGIELTIKQPVT